MKKIKNVLIIDDDEITCFINKSVLEEEQVAENILCLENEQEALEHILEQCSNKAAGEDNCPELIFLDLTMPLFNGFEFLEKLQNQPGINLHKLYIVILTSSWHTRDMLKVGQYKVQEYLHKPLTHEQVNDVVKRFHRRFRDF